MNECFEVTLNDNGKPMAVQDADDRGILFPGDASFRKVMLEFDGVIPNTKYRMERVRQLMGWRPWEFRLEPYFVKGGAIGFRGAGPDALPPGKYFLRLSIEDLIIPQRRYPFELKKDASLPIEVETHEDRRTINFTKPVAQFDTEFQRVLSRSNLDQNTAVDWLTDPTPKPKRKACLFNLLAKMRVFPSESRSLLAFVENVFFVDVDRVYAEIQAGFCQALEEMAGEKGTRAYRVYKEGKPASDTHGKLLDAITGHGKFELCSYRAEGSPSLQAVVALPNHGNGPHYADLDLDLGNPLQDVNGFFVHMGELIGPGRTDHLKLRDKLRGHVTQYLYYTVQA